MEWQCGLTADLSPSWREIASFAQSLDVDVVHVQAEPAFGQFVRQPTVVTIHGIEERDTLFRGNSAARRIWSHVIRKREQYFRSRIKNVIVISPYVRDVVGPQLRGRCWDIENPVRDDFFGVPRNPVPGRGFYGGMMNPRKNVDGMIRAFAKVLPECSEAVLRIAGHSMFPEYEQLCRQLTRELGVSDSVQFLGSLNVGEIKQELSSAAFLTLCSFQETAPLVIEEAMAAGVPVLASRICGIPWMIEDGVSGVLVDPHSDYSIQQGMKRMLRQSDLANMSAACQRIAEARFRVAHIADKTIAAYRDVLEETRASQASPAEATSS